MYKSKVFSVRRSTCIVDGLGEFLRSMFPPVVDLVRGFFGTVLLARTRFGDSSLASRSPILR